MKKINFVYKIFFKKNVSICYNIFKIRGEKWDTWHYIENIDRKI